MPKLPKLIFAAAAILSAVQPSFALDAETQRIIRDAQLAAPTQLEQVNDFIGHSKVLGKKETKNVRVASGQITAKLLTPLNSSFNQTGDEIQAVVVSSVSDQGKPWLEEGTILDGVVENAHKATYAQIDGTITIRFYKAHFGEKQIELFAASETDDGTIKPGPAKPLSKKQKIRGVLMTVTKIAVPAAIGTGGMSLAITTGAGAAIGLAFSEKGHRISGTARGAWEGAGLNFLDPIVCKGKAVVVPSGTAVQLQLTEEVIAPEVKVGAKKNSEFRTEEDVSATSLASVQTHAQILNAQTAAADDAKSLEALDRVNKKISQNDLASALVELQAAEDEIPNSSRLQDKHTELLQLISGQSRSQEFSRQ